MFTAVSNGETSTVTEVSGNAYARVQRDPANANWAAAAGGDGTTSNIAALSFPTPTPAGWGTITHFGIYDAPTGGNLLFYAELTGGSKTVNAGDSVSFAGGALTVTFN